MTLEFYLSKIARKDLENIWKYTFTNWSLKQADKYAKKIFNQINKVCSNPEMGRSIFQIKPNHRMTKVNSHLIVYKLEDSIVKIDRILHLNMEIENRL